MMKQLKTACKNHYQQQSLSAKQLDQLMALQKGDEQTKAHNTPRFAAIKTHKLLALAASLCLIVFCSWIYNSHNIDIREQIAKEIAYNHSKQMALEISSNDLNSVAAYLSELDFSLITSKKVNQIAQQLLGGRYCTIQGKLAAQLRIADNNSKSAHTYYQAPIPDNLNLTDTTYSTKIKDTHIKLWIEGDVLLGLASDKPIML